MGCQAPFDPHAIAVAHFDTTIQRYLEYRLDTVDHLWQTLEADPEFVMSHCLKGHLSMLASTTVISEEVHQSLAAAESRAAAIPRRERGHVTTLRARSEGDLAWACARGDDILFEYPTEYRRSSMHQLHATLLPARWPQQRYRCARAYSPIANAPMTQLFITSISSATTMPVSVAVTRSATSLCHFLSPRLSRAALAAGTRAAGRRPGSTSAQPWQLAAVHRSPDSTR
jgi:hypothetical protein